MCENAKLVTLTVKFREFKTVKGLFHAKNIGNWFGEMQKEAKFGI